MNVLKKLTGRDVGQEKHNNEDARVIPSKVPQNKDVEKRKSLKAIAVQAVKLARRFPYYCWIWERVKEAWGWFIELISS